MELFAGAKTEATALVEKIVSLCEVSGAPAPLNFTQAFTFHGVTDANAAWIVNTVLSLPLNVVTVGSFQS